MNNFIADMITRIRNGHRAKLKAILMHTYLPNFCIKILFLLKKEGFIRSFVWAYDPVSKNKIIKVYLKYDNNGLSVIKNIFVVSTRSKKIFASVDALWKPKTFSGIFIISTPKGLMTDRTCRYFNIGGKVICAVQ